MKQKEYAAKIAEAEIGRAKALGEAEQWKQRWIESEQAKGPAMAKSLECGKLEKILRIVGHITAGRSNDAIQELLQPMPVVIGLNIQFDENARVAHEEELFATFKKLIKGAVDSASLKREEKP